VEYIENYCFPTPTSKPRAEGHRFLVEIFLSRHRLPPRSWTSVTGRHDPGRQAGPNPFSPPTEKLPETALKCRFWRFLRTEKEYNPKPRAALGSEERVVGTGGKEVKENISIQRCLVWEGNRLISQ